MCQHHAAFPSSCTMLRSAHRQNLQYHKGQRLTAGCLCGGSKTFKRRILQASGAQAMANIAMYSPAIRKELPCKISTLMRRVRVWFHNATPNRGCPPYIPHPQRRQFSVTDKACPVHLL